MHLDRTKTSLYNKDLSSTPTNKDSARVGLAENETALNKFVSDQIQKLEMFYNITDGEDSLYNWFWKP